MPGHAHHGVHVVLPNGFLLATASFTKVPLLVASAPSLRAAVSKLAPLSAWPITPTCVNSQDIAVVVLDFLVPDLLRPSLPSPSRTCKHPFVSGPVGATSSTWASVTCPAFAYLRKLPMVVSRILSPNCSHYFGYRIAWKFRSSPCVVAIGCACHAGRKLACRAQRLAFDNFLFFSLPGLLVRLSVSLFWSCLLWVFASVPEHVFGVRLRVTHATFLHPYVEAVPFACVNTTPKMP